MNAPTDSLDIDSVSGAVSVNENGREASVETVSGSIRMDSYFDELDASSISGSVRVRVGTGAKSADIECVSGSVRVSVEAGVGYTLEYESAGGSVKDEYSGNSGGRKGVLKVGDGRVDISVETVSGSVSLEDWNN